MFKRILTPLILLLVALTACDHIELADEPAGEKTVEKVRRTLLVYMEGRNNLSSAALSDLDEMRMAGIPDDCRLLVYRSISGETNPLLIEIAGGEDSTLVTYPADALATDVEQMRRVFSDVKAAAPADEFAVVFWSHSSGWRQKSTALARAYGLEYSSRQMSVSDLASALNGQGVDFIFFDTCYMGSVEVAYELRNAARRMVASVCEVPTDGMPYNLTLPYLFDEDIDAGLINAIDTTVDFYTENRITKCPSTLSLIDLTAVGAVAEALKPMIKNEFPDDIDLQRFATSSTYRNLFFDLGQYMEVLGADTSALSAAVIYERHTPYPIWGTLPLTRCSGLTVGIPSVAPALYEKYEYYTLAWSKFLEINP